MSHSQGIYFELPYSSIRGIPLMVQGNHLHLGFVEVGCRPAHNRRKLKDKKELFYKYWSDQYQKAYGLDWRPQVYRMMAHYDPRESPRLFVPKYELDVVALYTYITVDMLAQMTEEDKQEVYRVVDSINKKRNLLEEIIETRDADRLHHLIVNARGDQQIAFVRGKMAEFLVLQDLRRTLPAGMNLFRNGDIHYFNRRYRNGTEIDGIQTFYDEAVYVAQIEALRSCAHLQVRDRWHAD